jgi:hypothetical protein
MTPRRTSTQTLTSRIHSIRGQRVLLDADLAELYGVPTKALIQAVKRNIERFPSDFMFILSRQDLTVLRSQFVTLDNQTSGRGKHRNVNIEIMRAFVRLRGLIQHSEELARRLDALEAKYDRQLKVVFDAIRELMAPPAAPKRRIGFVSGE